MRILWFAVLAGFCLLLTGCGESVEKKDRKVEGQSQALQTPATSSPANADQAGKSPREDSPTSPELTLKPTAPAADSSPADIGTTQSATATPDGGTTQSAAAPAAAPDTQAGEIAKGGGNDPTSASSASVVAQLTDLSQSASPYLRAAAKSQIKWQPFSLATFASAQQQNKPVLIDIGANWNHQCRRMAAEAYQDPQVVQTLNEKFVCVKADADIQPDVAGRYMAAYRLINNQETEYPLTVFALPDGKPFDVLSYVPATAQGEQAGMADLLKQVQDLFANNSAQVRKQADLVGKKLANAGKSGTGDLDSSAIRKAATAMSKAPEGSLVANGAQVALYLLHLYSDSGEKTQLEQASRILLDQFRSPLRDQVLGGYFHSAAADSNPRFEKLLPVQSSLLSANALAFAAGKKALHKEAAEEILRFCRDTLEAQGGGFYAAQDSSTGPSDNGSYFTWSRDEIFQLAGEGPDTKTFAQYLNAGDKKAPLYVSQKLQAAADANGVSYEQALKNLQEIRAKLRDARMQQESVPLVNKAIFASWNAEAIVAYLDAYKYLGDAAARDFALLSADFLINNMVSPKQGVAHVFYKGQAGEYGLLEDNAKFAAALMQCFEVSGQREYLESAESIMAYVERKFLDKDSGLYFDRAPGSAETAGLQQVALCRVEDGLGQCANASAVQAWYALYQATSKEEFREKAERMVKSSPARDALARSTGASMGRVSQLVTTGAPKVLIIAAADDTTAKAMHDAALPVFRMGKLVERMTPEEAAKTDYPPAKDGGAIAYVCTAKNCAPPVRDAAKLTELIKSFGRAEPASADKTEVAAPADSQPNSAIPAAAEKQTM